jgi:hypothetical protein
MRRLLLGALVVVALLTKTDPQSAHEYSRLGTVESIVDRGTYQLDGSTFIETVDKIYRDGHFYSHQLPLLATVETPVYWVLSLPGTRFNNRGRFVMTYAFSLLTNGLALALTMILFARLLALAGALPPYRDWLAALLILGTWLLPYGLVSNNHGISGLLLMLLAYLLLLIAWQGVTDRRAIAIGAVLGLLVTIELLPIVSFVPLALIYVGAQGGVRVRTMSIVAIGAILPLVAHAVINIRITGDVIPAGFHHELFNYPGTFFDGSSLSGGLKHGGVGEVAAYAWASLFGGKGFFTFAPVLLLAAIAGVARWRWWSRARGVHLVLGGGILLSLAASLLTTNNYGGEAVGFRHAAYLSPAFLVLLTPWIVDATRGVRSARYTVIAVAAVSCMLMLLLAVRNPWKPLSLQTATIGTWDEYLPIVAKVVRGDLFNP